MMFMIGERAFPMMGFGYDKVSEAINDALKDEAIQEKILTVAKQAIEEELPKLVTEGVKKNIRYQIENLFSDSSFKELTKAAFVRASSKPEFIAALDAAAEEVLMEKSFLVQHVKYQLSDELRKLAESAVDRAAKKREKSRKR